MDLETLDTPTMNTSLTLLSLQCAQFFYAPGFLCGHVDLMHNLFPKMWLLFLTLCENSRENNKKKIVMVLKLAFDTVMQGPRDSESPQGRFHVSLCASVVQIPVQAWGSFRAW